MDFINVDDVTTVFEYLDDLRESGETNMLGAAPYVQKQFKVGRDEARKLACAWMETFDGDDPALARAQEAIKRALV